MLLIAHTEDLGCGCDYHKCVLVDLSYRLARLGEVLLLDSAHYYALLRVCVSSASFKIGCARIDLGEKLFSDILVLVADNDKKLCLIVSVKNGVYVDEFSNGQVKIGEGDFTFFVKSGFLIEDGRLTMPIKDINIIGNGPQALADIVAVGNDLKIDNGTWTCGKEQSVAVSCGMPTVLISNLTVGGE